MHYDNFIGNNVTESQTPV